MFGKVTNSITFDADGCPANCDHYDVSVDTYGPILVSDNTDSIVGVVEYVIESKQSQQAAFEEIEEFLTEFVTSPDRFEEGPPSEMGTVTITYDGLSISDLIWEPPSRRFVFPQPELNARLNRLCEQALLQYVAAVTVDQDHWIDGRSFAYFVDESREYQGAREQANFAVHCRL